MEKLRTHYRFQQNLRFLLLALPVVWGIFSFIIYPNLKLLQLTFFSKGVLDIQPITQILRSERALRSLRNSFVLACCLTITINILGLFNILVLDYFNIKGRRWLAIAYHSPLICNGMVLVMAYNFMLGGQGFITANLMKMFPGMNPLWFQGFGAVLLEMTFAGTSNHILFVRDSLRSIDYQTIEAAQNVGVKAHRVLLKVVLPTLRPSIFAASILSFIVGMSAFATPQVLGGPNFETINPLIQSFANTLMTRNYAAVLAIFLGFVTLTILLLSNRIEKRRNYRSISKVKTPLKRQDIHSPLVRWIITALAHGVALIQTIPLVFVFIFSLMPAKDLYEGSIRFATFSLRNYLTVFTSTTGIKPVLTSVVYSALASIVVVSIMLLLGRVITKYKNKLTGTLEMLLQIPWFLPATLIALGMVMCFGSPHAFVLGRTLTGTIYLILFGYIVLKTPYTLRMIKAAYASLDGSLEEAAKNLGASAFKTYLRVLFPIILPTVLSIFLLNFISLLAEYNMSVFLFHPLYQPLGVVLNAATRADASPDAQMLSFVYSVIIMLVSSLTILFVYGRKNARARQGKME